SAAALAAADLGFLPTFGLASQNLQQSTFSAADSGLAIGIEALNKATGFSEEVRRFIPKNAILRNPNIDFASDLSAATNRLEPMARLQAHLLTEPPDLKGHEGPDVESLRALVGVQPGQPLDARDVRDAIRALHASARFSRVAAYAEPMGDGRIRIVFVLTPIEKLASVTFMGHKAFAESILL